MSRRRNGGDAIRLSRPIAARVACVNTGLLGRGVENAIEALDSDRRLATALAEEVTKHDRALGEDDLLTRLQEATQNAESIVARPILDGFLHHVQINIDRIRVRAFGDAVSNVVN